MLVFITTRPNALCILIGVAKHRPKTSFDAFRGWATNYLVRSNLVFFYIFNITTKRTGGMAYRFQNNVRKPYRFVSAKIKLWSYVDRFEKIDVIGFADHTWTHHNVFRRSRTVALAQLPALLRGNESDLLTFKRRLKTLFRSHRLTSVKLRS